MTDHRPTPAQPSANPPSRRRFALSGRSHAVDPRTDAARGDLADVRLADRIFAPHYAAAVRRSVVRQAPIVASHGGQVVSELLRGETFDVLELSHGHAWGVGGVDGAVGFVAVDALSAPYTVTHLVCGSGSDAPAGTRLSADEAEAADPSIIRPLDAADGDFVTAAEAMVGVPVVRGGRSGAGVDASGLLVLALSLAGLRAPRFVDVQATTLGHAVDADAPMLRGDLLFFADHVAIVADGGTAIHAGDEAVEQQPIATLIDAVPYGPLLVRRRLP